MLLARVLGHGLGQRLATENRTVRERTTRVIAHNITRDKNVPLPQLQEGIGFVADEWYSWL